jgi:hypothetical protein
MKLLNTVTVWTRKSQSVKWPLTGLATDVLLPVEAEEIFLFAAVPVPPPESACKIGQGVRLTTHVHLVLRCTPSMLLCGVIFIHGRSTSTVPHTSLPGIAINTITTVLAVTHSIGSAPAISSTDHVSEWNRDLTNVHTCKWRGFLYMHAKTIHYNTQAYSNIMIWRRMGSGGMVPHILSVSTR